MRMRARTRIRNYNQKSSPATDAITKVTRLRTLTRSERDNAIEEYDSDFKIRGRLLARAGGIGRYALCSTHAHLHVYV